VDNGRSGSAKSGWAVLIQGSRIAAIGPEAALRQQHPAAKTVSLPGGTLLPGLIDGHVHVESVGAIQREVRLERVQSPGEALRKIRSWANDHPDGWILGRGWDQNRWSSKAFPQASDLDAAIGDRPAALTRVDGHAVWANSAALKFAGITRDTQDPSGGRIVRDGNGEPTGVLVDAAMDLLTSKIPSPAPAEREARILDGLHQMKEFGFTAVADMGVDQVGLAIYRRLEAIGALPIRVFAYLANDPALMKVELAKPRKRDLAFFQVQGVKFYLDGALGSRGARLLAPYSDAPNQQGLWVTQPSAVRTGTAATLAAGYQPAIHAIGDAANRAALDLLKGLPRGPLPPRIEHAQIVEKGDAKRFGATGAVASVQPVHCASDHPWTPDRLGPARVGEAYPWRTFLGGGALLAFGTDAPNDDLNPYAGLAAAETRQDGENQPTGGFLPEHRLTRGEAIRGFTWGNGKALGTGQLGALKPGAVADLLWVEADLSKIAPAVLRKLRPGRLWVNGAEVPLTR
jgi:hypothetical protein